MGHLSDPPPHFHFMTMDEILEELRSLREIIQTLHPVTPSQSICEGVTGKGTRCRNRASPDSCYCRMHLGRKVGVKPVPKKKAQPKLKKVQPEHTCHDGGMCKLCDTHGDVWDPALVDIGFEGCVEIDVMD